MTKYYIITKLWTNPGEKADRSKWLDPNVGAGYGGPHMNPKTKTGQMCIMMGMDSRLNHETIRSEEITIRFITSLAVQVGMSNPEKTARAYFKNWINEGLLKEVSIGEAETEAELNLQEVLEQRMSMPKRSFYITTSSQKRRLAQTKDFKKVK